jgi:hypothetical protein
VANKKALKNIAYGLLGTFVSRYNDIGGYWGLGVLRLFAEKNQLSEITLDLMGDSANLPGGSPIRVSEEKYREWLQNARSKQKVADHKLAKAEINIRFTTFEEFPDVILDTRGRPYVCTVTIVLERGPIYSASKLGVCECHDPRRDLRSTRSDDPGT